MWRKRHWCSEKFQVPSNDGVAPPLASRSSHHHSAKWLHALLCSLSLTLLWTAPLLLYTFKLVAVLISNNNMIPSSPADNNSIASEPSLLAATAAMPRTTEAIMNEARPLRSSLVHYCYASPQQAGEMMLSIAIFALGKAIPFVFDSVFTWTSPIPYETTQDGEVLLELDLSYELVSVETVPDWLAAILCILFPILLFFTVGFRTGQPGDVHASMCCFLINVGLSWFLTDMIKIYTGQLRPNFYEMCSFNKQTLECETESAHLLKESRRSFPSGHASLAFSSMTTLTLYLIGKVGIQRHVHSKRITLCTRVWYLLSFLPLLLAFFVAASRVHDFWHHPADVVAGSAIGIGCALSVHGMWYVLHNCTRVGCAMQCPFSLMQTSILVRRCRYPSVYSEWSGRPLDAIHSLSPASEPSLLPQVDDEEPDENYMD